MKKRKNKVGFVWILFFVGLLTGCKSESVREAQIRKENNQWLSIAEMQFAGDEDMVLEFCTEIEQEEMRVEEVGESESIQEEIRYENIEETRPKIPLTGNQLADFIPENWELFQQASLDFNQDGVEDFVGIMRYIQNSELYTYDYYSPFFPYILFAVASEGDQGYRLNFQDVNLITTWREASMSGIYYKPITTDGVSFTTHIIEGRTRTENFTYTYREGTWYLTKAELIYESNGYMSEYLFYDFQTKTVIRKQYCGKVGEAEKTLQERFKKESYEEIDGNWYLVYKVALDEAPTLFQAGMRQRKSLERVWDWSVDSIKIKEGIDLELEEVFLDEYCSDCDEDGVVYILGNCRCLAYYQWKEKSVSVLERSEDKIVNAALYKGKIYYVCAMIEPVFFYNDKGEVKQGEDWTGLQLYQINLDGTEKRLLFEYHLLREERNFIEENIDSYFSSVNVFINLIFKEITEKEMIVEVFDDVWMPIYRIDFNSGENQLIGYTKLE